jgi:hypothetical protein
MNPRAKDVLGYILANTIQPISKEPIDYSYETSVDWESTLNGTLMPPSPGVRSYYARFHYNLDSGKIEYNLDVEWRDVTKWLVKQLPSWQVTHRSRSMVLAFSPLRIWEQERKLQQVREWYHKMVRHSLPPSISEDVYRMFFEKTLKYLTFDWVWVQRYIKDHETSSIGGGYKWRDTKGLDSSSWQQIFDNVKEMAENMASKPGHWINIHWNSGMRARSDSLTSVTENYSGEMDRTRIIQFHPCLSLQNIFLPRKKEYFSEVLGELQRMVQARPTFHFPYTEGGMVYDTLYKLHRSGQQLSAMDGKNWEASVGILLGPAFSTLMLYVKGIAMLGSGGFHTSTAGTMANIVQNRNVEGDIVALGDDMSIFSKRKYVSQVPWVEEDAGDTAHKVTLGISFGKDLEQPVVTGIKAMSDRAKKAIPIRIDPLTYDGEAPVLGRRDPREISLWIGLYMGYFGDKTLLETLKSIDLTKRDYVSPGELIEQMVTQQETNIDPYAWAERYGVKRLIIA